MSTQNILAVAGILATTIFGLWAIAAAFRFSRNVRITYALDQVIALTDDITQSFQDLGITFRGEPVSANLVLLKGYLINTGRRDISREMIEDQISVHVPPEFEWVDCKVAGTSPSLHVEAERKSAQEITFVTGLWKRKEYMKFEALAKVPVVDADPENPPDERPTVRLRKAISFTHRIADSDRIEHTRVPRPSRFTGVPFPFPFSMGSAKMNCIMACVVLAMGIFFLVAAKFGFMSSKQLGYTTTIDGVERVVTVRVKGEGLLLSGEGDFSQKSTLAEFQALPDKRPALVTKADDFPRIGGMIYSAMGLLMLGVYGLRAVKDRRMLALIASKEEA
jgi:hypothetical protein